MYIYMNGLCKNLLDCRGVTTDSERLEEFLLADLENCEEFWIQT